MDYSISPRAAIFQEGWAARLAGKAPEECPYMSDSDHARAWLVGFRDPCPPFVFKADRIYLKGNV